ncbi:MAG: hypothetical protein SOH48_09515 [Eubacteriales bacterium]
MAITIEYCSKYKSYNGKEVTEGTVLAPFVISDEEYAANTSIIKANIRKWKVNGVIFKIGFMVVPREDFDKMVSLYHSAINDYFEEHPERRPGRCLLGMDTDGLPILCNKHDHNCTDCPHRYEGLPRYRNLEDFIQFESFQDTKTDDDGNEVSLDVADPTQDTEGTALLAVLFDELMEYLQEKNPRYAEMVRLGKEGKSKAEIFEAVGLESSFGYKEWNRAKKLCEEFLAD